MTLNKQDTIAARSAIARGDLFSLERYLREGVANQDPINITSSTVALNRQTHEGRAITFNIAGGFTATLPAATGSQDVYVIVVGTTLTGNGIVKVANSNDTMTGFIGYATLTFGALSGEACGTTDDTITMNGTTTGGVVGSRIICTDIASNLWMVAGDLIGVGAGATSLSSTV